MKFKYIQSILFILAFSDHYLFAQTSAGNSFHIDFPSWNAGSLKPPVYIDCGNSNLFNTGQELTMEVWVRVYNSAWNQKILGKVTNTFNNGYVMAMEVGKIYSEIWDPNLNVVKDGSSPNDSAWVHLATTYAAGGTMTSYINGVNIGAIPVAGSSITSSSNNFIIGIAPWDLISLQTFGNIDEVRIWSISRSQTEIQEFMHKQLTGNEPGLVAYYDFNVASGTTLPDRSPNLLDGTVSANAGPYVSWQNSFAAVGDSGMYSMHNVAAIWFGKDSSTYNFAATTSGLNLIGKIQPKTFDYAVYGDNDSAGVSNTFIPAGAATDFNRLSRQWYFNTGGNVTSDLYFNLVTASGGGSNIQLPILLPSQNYTLLVRDSASQDFIAIYGANSIIGSTVIKFDNIPLQNGKYYTIGVGSTQIASPSAIDENELYAKSIALFPIPASNSIQINNVAGSRIVIYNAWGNVLKEFNASVNNTITLPVYDFENGFYYARVTKGNQLALKKFLVSK